MSSFDVVIPSAGRSSLGRTLEALAASAGPLPRAVIVVCDGPTGSSAPVPARLAGRTRVLTSAAPGPAAARNAGWREAAAEWVAFLDDDVVPALDWLDRLAADLEGLPADVAGSQGAVRVPLPEGRRATDWERNTKGLEDARWATADMAYRRAVLAELGGFDERFGRAYREDSDLALRAVAAGYRLVAGSRVLLHPVRPAGFWASVRAQAGNADDALMRVLHGPGWRDAAGAPRGRRRVHVAVTAAGAAALVAAALRRPRVAALAGVGYAAGVAELAWRRIVPGPRDPVEVARMMATSALIPAAATYHWLAGRRRAARARCRPAPAPKQVAARA